MITTERLHIIPATPKDINHIIDIEHHPDNRNYIWQGTAQEHSSEIDDPDHELLLFRERQTDEIVGYCLNHINRTSEIFELRRIAITRKGQGYGREALTAIIKHAFDDLPTNRFWLDVYPDNLVGIKLYESMGFIKEGILRQNYKSARGYLDQIIYSILRTEYESLDL